MDATKPAHRSLATKPARLSTSGHVSPHQDDDDGDSCTTTSSYEAEEKAAAARGSPTYKPKRRVKRRTDAPSALPAPPPADDSAHAEDTLMRLLKHMQEHGIPLYLMEQNRFLKPPAAIPFPINYVHARGKTSASLSLGAVSGVHLTAFEGRPDRKHLSFWPLTIELYNVAYDSHTQVRSTMGGWAGEHITLYINRKVWLANAASVMRGDADNGRPVVDWVERVSKALPDHEFVIPPVPSA